MSATVEILVRRADSRAVPLVGRRFGRLVAETCLGVSDESARVEVYGCLCDCGKRTKVRRNHLLQLRVQSCGCYRSFLVLPGMRIGHLTVVSVEGERVQCRCDCGRDVTRVQVSLRPVQQEGRKLGTSCGCLYKAHGRVQIQVGSTYGSLTVLERVASHLKTDHQRVYLCQCVCGVVMRAYGPRLARGETTRCMECARASRCASRRTEPGATSQYGTGGAS